MSEPNAAFLQLHIRRADLVRWLDAPVPRISDWGDWRAIGGEYHFSGDVTDIAVIGEDELEDELAEAASGLGLSRSNRAALRGVLGLTEAAGENLESLPPPIGELDVLR